MNTPDGPLLIVGWDSATYELIDEFDEDLDTLQQLKAEGAYGDLRTAYPPGTIPGWPCLTTGMNPGKLNTQRLAAFRRDEFQPNTGEENVEIWDVVDHLDGTACVVNMPSVVEAYGIDGAMVAGFLSTEESTNVSPANLLNSLDVDADLQINWEDVDKEGDIFTAAMDIAEKRYELVTALMAEFDWDFFIVNFDAPDRIAHSRLKYMDDQHPFYTDSGSRKYGDDLRQCYVRLDQMLAELIPDAGNVFVISDHGMEPCRRRININDWLIEHGYLVVKGDGNDASPTLTTRVFSAGKNVVTRHGLIDYVPDFFKRKSVVSMVDDTSHISDVDVDWEATTAYVSDLYGGIDVIADDEEPVKRQLIDDLETLEEPSVTVIDSADIYHGENIQNVPDLFLDFDDYILPTHQVGAVELLEPSSTGGKHSMDGIFVASGPGIRSVGEIEGADVMDVTPTALHLLGAPIPTAVDGDPLDILTTDREPDYRDPDIDLDKGRDEMTEAERQEVMETLEDIGYM